MFSACMRCDHGYSSSITGIPFFDILITLRQVQILPEFDAKLSTWQWSAEISGTMQVHKVRNAYRNYLTYHAKRNADISEAELIVAELLANVKRYAPGHASFHLDWNGPHPHVLVLDRGPGFPLVPKTTLADLNAESGRGLALIKALALEMKLGNRADGGGYVYVKLPVERIDSH